MVFFFSILHIDFLTFPRDEVCACVYGVDVRDSTGNHVTAYRKKVFVHYLDPFPFATF